MDRVGLTLPASSNHVAQLRYVPLPGVQENPTTIFSYTLPLQIGLIETGNKMSAHPVGDL